MIDDYISRKDAVQAIMNVPDGNWSKSRYANEIANNVKGANVVPVIFAHWINLSRTSVCSACNFETGRYGVPTKYCGGCGAKMDGGGKE